MIRLVAKEDIPDLKKVLDSSELFPSSMLDEMIEDYFENDASTDIWFTYLKAGISIAVGYCAPERMTEGTFNLYAIAVDKNHQGKGIGKSMMNFIETLLKEKGNRILIVETSGKKEFEITQDFYLKCNYVKQAVIPHFYDEDDDKIVFWKKLN